jgi:hypothetical protein
MRPLLSSSSACDQWSRPFLLSELDTGARSLPVPLGRSFCRTKKACSESNPEALDPSLLRPTTYHGHHFGGGGPNGLSADSDLVAATNLNQLIVMDMLVLHHFSLRLLPIGWSAPLRRPLFYLVSFIVIRRTFVLCALLLGYSARNVPRMLRYTTAALQRSTSCHIWLFRLLHHLSLLRRQSLTTTRLR